MALSNLTFFGGDIADGSHATPGLWNRRFSALSQNIEALNRALPYRNVKDFGAIGDGITDDTSAFSSALSTPGTVFVPEGTYLVKNLHLRTARHLIGSGKSSLLKLPSDSTVWDMILLTGDENEAFDVTIRNLSFDGSQDSIGLSDVQMHAIDVRSGTSNLLIEGCAFRDTAGDGIRIAPDGSALPTLPINVAIINCTFEDHERQDIALVGGARLVVANCFGTGTLDLEPEVPSREVTATGNQFTNFFASNTNTDERSRYVITGNSFTSAVLWRGNGYTFAGNLVNGRIRVSDVEDVQIFGNMLKIADFWPTSQTSVKRVSFVGNRVRNVAEADSGVIPGEGRTAGVVIWRSEDCLIADNLIEAQENGMIVTGEHERLTIRGNIITHNSTGTKTGLHFETAISPNDVFVHDNVLSGWSEAGIMAVGAANLTRFEIKNNVLQRCNSDFSGIYLGSAKSGLIEGNVFYDDSKIFIASNNHKLYRNVFLNSTASTPIRLENGKYDVGWNVVQTGESVYSTVASNATLTHKDAEILSTSTFRVAQSGTPATGDASGTTGDIAWDEDFIYVCASEDSWRRAALSTF